MSSCGHGEADGTGGLYNICVPVEDKQQHVDRISNDAPCGTTIHVFKGNGEP